jgi:aminoglycoside 6'-N-acetyltransferase I
MPVIVRPVTPDDAEAWLRLRDELWPDHEDNRSEIDAFFRGGVEKPLAVLLAVDEELGVVGLVELSLRPYAEGCETSPVAYVEGWFIDETVRRQGVGRLLIQTAEQWARERGCTELASDTKVENEVSAAAHASLGFEETNRMICFRKRLC